MRKIKNILIVLAMAFVLTSCDDIKQIMSIIPKFETDLPNVISGKFAYFESPGDVGYSELLIFDPSTMEFSFENVESGTQRGSYSYQYIDFNITICNGTLLLTYEDGRTERYGFLYEATATDGPSSITLNRNGQSKVYVYKGK